MVSYAREVTFEQLIAVLKKVVFFFVFFASIVNWIQITLQVGY